MVVIYQGIKQRIAWISLSKPYQLTGIQLAQVPALYQQTLKATVAASSLRGAQAIVGNIRSEVAARRQQYTALQDWAAAENGYQRALAQARQQHKPVNDLPTPGPQPGKAAATCPPSAAFGIPASAVVPDATEHS